MNLFILFCAIVICAIFWPGRRHGLVHVRINCTFNDNGAWCKNDNVKRSLLGVGARCCVLYPGLNGNTCQWQNMYPRPNSPPRPHLEERDFNKYPYDGKAPLQEDRGLPPVQHVPPMPPVKPPKIGIQPSNPWPRK